VTEDQQLLEDVRSGHDPVEVGVVEHAPCPRQVLMAVSHGHRVAADLVHAAGGMVHRGQHEPAVGGEGLAALAPARLLHHPARVLDPDVRDLVEHGRGQVRLDVPRGHGGRSGHGGILYPAGQGGRAGA
jgi:hypothetical protein